MWLVTTQGFYSVVAHRGDPDRVLVRARVREDLEALRQQIAGIEPVETPGADYRWRAEVSRDEWQGALAALGGGIDYDNFKTAVAEQQGWKREAVYHKVWAALARLQRP